MKANEKTGGHRKKGIDAMMAGMGKYIEKDNSIIKSL